VALSIIDTTILLLEYVVLEYYGLPNNSEALDWITRTFASMVTTEVLLISLGILLST